MMAAPEVDGLRKRFGAETALNGLNLVAAEGDVVALLGPNGAGKTTLVLALGTLLAPDAGGARVLEYDVVADPYAVRAKIGLDGQFAAVDEILTGRENFEMVGRLTGMTPAAVRAFADVNPMALCVNAVRYLMLGGHATVALDGTLAWLAGVLLVFVPLAVGRYRALE